MSQVSYGTITITDTTDIERIYMVYAGSDSSIVSPDVNDFNIWKMDITQTSGSYIWQRAVVKKSGIEITSTNFQQFYGDPVCVTGEGGRGIKSITTYYCNYGTGTPDENYSGWNIETPEYDENKPNYWVKMVIIYVDDSEEEFDLNGQIVTIEDGEHKQITSLEVALSPIQDLHGYDHPWAGGSGANKYDNSIAVDNSRFTTTGTGAVNGLSRSDYIEITPNESYYFMGVTPNNSGYSGVFWYDENKAFVRADGANGATPSTPINLAVTAPSTAKYVGINMFTTNKDNGAVNYPSTVTEWTPYSNICPISGRTECVTQRTGKNLFDGTLLNGYYDADNNGAFVSSANWRATNKMRCKPSTTYVMSGTSYSGGSYNGRSFFWDMNGNYLGARGTGANFTSYPNSAYMALYFGASYVTDAIQIEEGSTSTDYEPYQGTTYTTSLGRTVYGGTLDVVSGELVVDREMVTLDGTQSFVSQGNLTNTKHYSYDAPNMSNSPGAYSADVISDKMPTIADNSDTVHINHRNIGIHVWIPSDKTPSVWFAENPTTVVYPLATPQTYTLTAQQVELLMGTNNVWSDSGEVEVFGFTIIDRDVQIHFDSALTKAIADSAEANKNAAIANSIAQHANEDAQGALGIARAMQQNFWWWGEDHIVDSSFTLPAGAYTSDIKVDAFKANPTGGYLVTRSDGIYLNNGRYVLMGLTGNALKFYRPGTTKLLSGTETVDAQLDANGLVLKKGGIVAGNYDSTKADTAQNFVYLSSEDYGTAVKIGNSSSDKTDWRQIIGKKFGVDKAGNLYAAGADIEGAITATSLTISSGAQVSGVVVPSDIVNLATQEYADNAAEDASYSVEIKVSAIDYVANTATLVAIPYFQGSTTIPADVTLIYTWYKDSVASANTVGSNSSTLSVTATMGLNHNYICVISK